MSIEDVLVKSIQLLVAETQEGLHKDAKLTGLLVVRLKVSKTETKVIQSEEDGCVRRMCG